MISEAHVGQIALEARAFLMPRWLEWHAQWGPPHPATPSQWTCVRSSAFMAAVLTDAGLPARLQSGVPDPPRADYQAFGFRSGDCWHSHAWASCRGLIVDVTGDQFGEAEITVTADEDGRYRAGSEAATTLRLSPSAALAVDQLILEWRARGRSRI